MNNLRKHIRTLPFFPGSVRCCPLTMLAAGLIILLMALPHRAAGMGLFTDKVAPTTTEAAKPAAPARQHDPDTQAASAQTLPAQAAPLVTPLPMPPAQAEQNPPTQAPGTEAPGMQEEEGTSPPLTDQPLTAQALATPTALAEAKPRTQPADAQPTAPVPMPDTATPPAQSVQPVTAAVAATSSVPQGQERGQKPSQNKEEEKEQEKAAPRQRLFGTVEFKGPVKNLPEWLGMLERNAKNPIFTPGFKLNAQMTWDKLKGMLMGKSQLEQIRGVNSFWNQWPYRLDPAVYGKPDYWAAPYEFQKKSGDCEDYSIAKYFTLKELGFSVEQMRIVVLKDNILNIAHAVLAVYLDDEIYILDNLSKNVLPHSRIKHYLPQYSVNEQHRWVHVRPK